MSHIVKVGGATKVSSKNQVTLPVAVLTETGIETGDRLVVVGVGDGKIILERVEDLVDDYAGRLTGMIDRTVLEVLDTEWD